MRDTADLDELFSGHFMSPVPNPYRAYATLRRDAPVMRVNFPMGPGYLVTRYDDVRTVLGDPTLFSSRANANGIDVLMGRTILEMDGKEHRRHRNIIASAFAPKTLKGDLTGVITRLAHQLVDDFDRNGRADLVTDFALTFPLRVIAHIIGIPVDDFHTFQQWAFDIIGFTDDPPRGFASAAALVDFLRPVMAQRKAEPQDDLMSTLVHAEVEGERLTDEEIYPFLRLLVPAGAETTYRLIGNTLYALLTHPEQLAAIQADRAQLDWAIEETLRWEAPVQYAAREATTPVTVSGVEIPANGQILVALGSANRDERHYLDPDRFEWQRKADDHLAFGFGRHFCAGFHLARLEARVALNTLFDRLQHLRLDPAASTGVVGLAFRSPTTLPVLFDT